MSSPVDKFFATTDSAALFPEYISRAVRTGLESADVLSEIIAAKTVIDGLDYRPITSVLTDDDKALKETAEGTAIPETSVKTQENLVKTQKARTECYARHTRLYASRSLTCSPSH